MKDDNKKPQPTKPLVLTTNALRILSDEEVANVVGATLRLPKRTTV